MARRRTYGCSLSVSARDGTPMGTPCLTSDRWLRFPHLCAQLAGRVSTFFVPTFDPHTPKIESFAMASAWSSRIALPSPVRLTGRSFRSDPSRKHACNGDGRVTANGSNSRSAAVDFVQMTLCTHVRQPASREEARMSCHLIEMPTTASSTLRWPWLLAMQIINYCGLRSG